MSEIKYNHNWLYCKEHRQAYYGDCPKCFTKATPQDDISKIYDLRKAGKSQSAIAKAIGKTQQYVSKVLKRSTAGPVKERFHAFSIRFNAHVDYDGLQLPEKLLKNVSYKIIEYQEFYCQAFKKSIVISFRKEYNIYDLKCKVANELAISKLSEYIKLLPKEIIVLDDVVNVVSRHNAFVNDIIAKKLGEKGQTLKVVVDGKTRLITDHSKGRHELEAIDKEHCVPDSTKIEDLYGDLITKPSDLPSVQTSKTDFIMNALANYSENMNRHVSVMENIDRGIVKLNGAVDRLADNNGPASRNLHNKVAGESPARPYKSTSPSVHKWRRMKQRGQQ